PVPYSLSLHDALPISKKSRPADMCGWTGHIQGNGALRVCEPPCGECAVQRSILSPGGYQGEGISVLRSRQKWVPPGACRKSDTLDRKSTRLNSSHVSI